MCSYSPSTTEPTESRSKLSAKPKVLPGNSSISPCITSDRPCTRTMPSVTLTTVPSVRASVSDSKFSMRLRIKLLISEGLSFICFSLISINLLSSQGVCQLGKTGACRTVDYFVSGADNYPAHQFAVCFAAEPDFTAHALFHRRSNFLLLCRIQFKRGSHQD